MPIATTKDGNSMDTQNVHICFYIFSTINVLFILVALGKFFCVKKLYDLYDRIDKIIDGELTEILTFATGISILASFSIMYSWDFITLTCMFAMSLCIVVPTITVIGAYMESITKTISDFHKNIKRKKNIN